MKIKMKVYKEGGDVIGVLPMAKVNVKKRNKPAPMSEEKKLIRKYFIEAKQKGTYTKKETREYIQDKLLNDPEHEPMLVPDEDIRECIGQELHRLHLRVKRYKRKFGFFHPNYFVTFTYDSKKTDSVSFERKLRRSLANLATRNDWRYIGVKEYGGENGRVHFHFLINIPDGKMIGELFTDYHWNGSKREYFINNTYFSKRFGFSQFDRIEGDINNNHKLVAYIQKYMLKQDAKLIYSRHLPGEIEAEVDTEDDVYLTFYDFSFKCYLRQDFFGDFEYPDFEYYEMDPEGMGFNLDAKYCRPFWLKKTVEEIA